MNEIFDNLLIHIWQKIMHSVEQAVYFQIYNEEMLYIIFYYGGS